MILSPLRFKSAQDVEYFLTRLHAAELIHIELINGKQEITIPHAQELSKKFLKANDGNVYFLDDVRDYVLQASGEEVDAVAINFFHSEMRTVNLTQIKADPQILNQISYSSELTRLIVQLNPALYESSFRLNWANEDEVHRKKVCFDNSCFHSTTSLIAHGYEAVSTLMGQIKSLLATSANDFMQVPIPLSTVPYAYSNLFKITLFQEAKLKSDLLNEISKSKSSEVTKKLNEWIKEIDANRVKAKEFLLLMSSIFKQECEKIEAAKTHYQQIIEEDPTLEKIKQKIIDLNKKIQLHKDQLARKESAHKILKPITTYGTLVVLPIALLVTAVALVGVFAPVALLPLMLSIGLLLAVVMPILIHTTPLIDGLIKVYEAIKNSFSLSKKITQIQEMLSEVSVLKRKIDFATQFPKVEKELDLSAAAYVTLSNGLEADLNELNDFDAQERAQITKKKPVTTTAASVSTVSMFKRSESMPSLSTMEQPEEHQLGRSHSFSYSSNTPGV